ncbi:anthrax toxin receptor-like [Tursiops truncatus]|uniref:anthrax toxin receptor-like n=1 Tax=Tursiops truncatus TaxID=9739 RepID=UPI003CCF84A5
MAGFAPVEDENELMISGKGFNNAKKKDEVICRFKFSDKQLFDIKAESVKDTSITCPGVKIEEPDQEVFVEVSLNNGVSFINNNVSITSKNCASTREARLDDRNAPPAAQQPPEGPRSSPPPQFTPYVNPLYFCALIPALLLFLLMLWCIWWLCRRKTIKEPPPVQKPERKLPDKDADSVFSSSEPEETCQMSCPTVIVPCGCQGGRMKRMEGKLDTLCDFVQHCNQMSLMWCPPRDMLPPGLWVREPCPGICQEERPRRGDLELMSLQTILNMVPVHFPCVLVSRMSGPFFSRAMPSNSNLKRKGLERPVGLPSIVPPHCLPDPVGLLAAPHP